jgi:hypothetical protein
MVGVKFDYFTNGHVALEHFAESSKVYQHVALTFLGGDKITTNDFTMGMKFALLGKR